MSAIPLNPTQQEAVEYFGSPLLILAGAGSGKTRVLTQKIVHIVEKQLCEPQNILAVTFTNKAAKEMKNRVAQMLPPHLAYPIWISTFHSMGVQILRKYAEHMGYKRGFSIYDDSDQNTVIKKVLKKLNINEKIITPKFVQSRINMAKSQALSDVQIAEQKHLFSKEFFKIYSEYEAELKQANAFDFNDLISKTLYLIEHFPNVQQELQNTFHYILVDEYQDTNSSQYRLMRALCRDKNNICVVGDEDQSIYAWRGADITNILNFEKDFPGTKIVKLEQNYRSTKNIISAAQGVIQNNSQRHDKTLFTENPTGQKVQLVEVDNEYDEAKFVADRIHQINMNGESYNKMAVFYRTNAQSRVIEEQFRNKGISYKLYGGMRFYDRKEIKDVVSYLNLILNPTDDVCFKRVVNVPARGLGKTSIETLEDLGISNQTSLVEAAMNAVKNKSLTPRACKQLGEFLNILVKLRDKSEALDIYSLYNEVLHDTGYLKELEHDETVESQSRIENLQEFGNAILRFTETHHEDATLDKFLNDMALVSDVDQDDDPDKPTVTMMTLHISKGLEFPFVFMIGMEDGLFPSAQSLEDNGGNRLEEERRLCYVGMTRAEEQLFMSHARTRRHWGDHTHNPPSRFLDEIPADLAEQVSLVARRPQFMNRFSGAKAASQSQYDAFPDYENESNAEHEHATYKKGMRVRHPIFGSGQVHQVEGSGDNTKVSIVFGDHTVKKFIARHANLTIL